MENNSSKQSAIPAGISSYINEKFHDDFLTEIKMVKDKSGKGYYYVDVTHNDNVFHLTFDGSGKLLKQEIEPILSPDDELEIGNVD